LRDDCSNTGIGVVTRTYIFIKHQQGLAIKIKAWPAANQRNKSHFSFVQTSSCLLQLPELEKKPCLKAVLIRFLFQFGLFDLVGQKLV
jgi:hypothetical protein